MRERPSLTSTCASVNERNAWLPRGHWLAANPSLIARGVVRHLLTCAAGATADPLERSQTEQIAEQSASENCGLRSLAHGVAL